MGNCLGCNIKLGFWRGYSTSDGEWCKKCFPKRKEILNKINEKKTEQKNKEKFIEQEVKKEKEKKKRLVYEYERKCNKCGKIWHSLKKEEDSLKTGTKLNALAGLATAMGEI